LSLKKTYRKELDGLRAFAVLAVLINHFNKDFLINGYLGVDIFFVLSGYVITLSLTSKTYNSTKDFLISFFERRIKRILPALIFYILSLSILICFFNPYPGESLFTGIFSLLGSSNIYLWKISNNYFAQATELNPFINTWSLGVEEQFYLIFPFLILVSRYKSKSFFKRRNLASILLIGSFISLVLFFYFYSINPSISYYLMPMRFWEISTGCLIYLSENSFLKNGKIFNKLNPNIILSLIIILFFLPLSYIPILILINVFLSSLLIISIREKYIIYKLFSLNLFRYLGFISYSLYLWHWGVLAIGKWTIGVSKTTIPILLFLTFAISILSYELIEKKFRHKDFSFNKIQTIFVGIIYSIFSILFIVLLGRPFKGILYLGNHPELHTRGRVFKNAKTYFKSDKKIESPEFSGTNCHIEDNDKLLNYDNCKIQNGLKTFFFVGNSHNDAYKETQFLLAKNADISVDSISVSNCLFPHINSQDDCNYAQKYQKRRILDLVKKGDVIVIINRYEIFNKNKEKNYPWFKSDDAIYEINSLFKEIKQKEAKLILFGPGPEFKDPIYKCQKQWFRPWIPKNCSINLSKMRKYTENYSNLISSLNKEIIIYDPIKPLCFDNKCNMTDSNNKPLFHDTNHINDYSNKEYIFKDFYNFLIKNNFLNKN